MLPPLPRVDSRFLVLVPLTIWSAANLEVVQNFLPLAGPNTGGWVRPLTVPVALMEPKEVLSFMSYFYYGLMVPFFVFFPRVLEVYQIHLVHLTPNAILTLAIIAHQCKMFVGVEPSVELFRYFYLRAPRDNPGVVDAYFFKLH
jgi:hypothetical protein